MRQSQHPDDAHHPHPGPGDRALPQGRRRLDVRRSLRENPAPVNARRLFASLLLAAWFAPAAGAGATALHLELDHGEAPRGGMAAEALQAFSHGHDHTDGAAEHSHLAAMSAAPSLRQGKLAGAESGAALPLAGADSGTPLPRSSVSAPRAEPAWRARGPALLALLSLLRI